MRGQKKKNILIFHFNEPNITLLIKIGIKNSCRATPISFYVPVPT